MLPLVTLSKLEKLPALQSLANMDDLEGASRLFDEYQDSISFGIHLNLTEGHPLRYSQELLDRGYYKETANVAGEKGNIYLNINQLRNKIISTSIQKELEKELCAQIEKVLDYGIRISHIDSHHHIHTSLLMLRMMPKLAKRYGIHKMRRMRNYVPSASWTNMALRDLWKQLIKLQNHRIVMTDYFGIYEEWYDNGKQILHENTVLTRVRDNILKSKEQKNIQPTKGGHKMVTCQNYVSLFYRQITSCPSDGGIS